MQKLHIANSDGQRGLGAGGHHQTVVWAIVGAIHESPLHESPLQLPIPPQPHRQSGTKSMME
ncbi:MAG: hypothetical protein HQM12_22345 [SAR324 cluster bacterium]|nr:hypothetical protein [SAR324 cluster bacterium]